MKAKYPGIGLEGLCGLFGMTGNAWHHRRKRKECAGPDHTGEVLEMVKVLRKRQCRLGTPKLYEHLKPSLEAMGIKMGRNSLNELLQSHGMGIRQRKGRIRTTDSSHGRPTYPNLAAGLEPDGPHQLWVGDITYLRRKRGGFFFLILLTDAYSHMVVGWNVSMTMTAEDCMVALDMALGQLPQEHSLIHHTDRGGQYIDEEYVKKLTDRGIRISMTESGDPRENPVAERMNGILKHELGLKQEFGSLQQARTAAGEAIAIYNRERLHSSCDYMTPEKAHQATGPLRKRWKNLRKERAMMKRKAEEENANGPA
ncbi:MAG: IS3 family transposase [Bacteroidia bacterium]